MGDSLMSLEPFFRGIAYILLAITAAYVWMWAAAIAAGAYLLGCVRGKPRWLFAILKLLLALTASTIAIYCVFGDHKHHLVYARYWAGLFCLLGHLFPCTNHFKRVPGLLPAKVDRVIALALPVVSTLLYRDVIVLLLSLLCGGVILWSTKRGIL